MTVWYAYPELLEKTGLSPPDLSNELGRISKNLFKAHPDLYLKQVAISWLEFWKGTGLIWNVEQMQNPILRKLYIGFWIQYWKQRIFRVFLKTSA